MKRIYKILLMVCIASSVVIYVHYMSLLSFILFVFVWTILWTLYDYNSSCTYKD